MRHYSVNKLAKLAGVSVRTLHHYDRVGLLKPVVRTETKYRLYGEKELIRLQQILFYKELDFSLDEILHILEDPEFDTLKALESHKLALQARQFRLSKLLLTIDKTISTLKGERVMVTNEELYEGFPKGREYRQEAIEKYGKEAIESSEAKLQQMGKAGFEQLKADQQAIAQILTAMVDHDPASLAVQQQIARHYVNIRGFWGEKVCQSKDMAKAYKGLAQLYLDDPRFTSQNGIDNPDYASFLHKAMVYFADTQIS
ncbi:MULTISPECIES: MerR family transcriptional regulator [unclassified Spirosoma]|uniref:MerR family transcriptional regulator n=1 Tax=unclassified Spirosoma TaxID=2621999 RepID=UPI00095CA8D4|nr:MULTISPECIES: MerR family transcriptional regulator [unclassified Spirosoma]MBN8823397.1 MerR family transcriptional regulator [Spirosoma sp.]OJW71985.1 MAG: MerR family transcriptional regulator [Spirosoma sp. 48-14]